EARRREVDAALALNRLDHDGDGLIVDQRFGGLEVAKGGVTKASQHRLHATVIFRLTRGAEGAHRAAVKAVEGSNDLVALMLGTIEAGQLDGRLVGLGAAVTEEAFASEVSALAQFFGQAALRFHVPGIGHMDELADLFAHRGDDARRAVADEIAAPAGEEIDIAVPFRVPDQRALATYQANWVACVVADHVLLKLLDRLCGGRHLDVSCWLKREE